MQMSVLVTGSGGFIGFHVCQSLLDSGEPVIGVDNFNTYYNVDLKRARHALLENSPQFESIQADISDRTAMEALFQKHSIERVVHLAAQAGVRYSLTHPHQYTLSNLNGFGTILELCRQHDVKHFVFASSSSVYGANKTYPFKETDVVDHPISLYAATKKANELMAHSYAHLYQLPCTGLRFFTVYGPWGRPDMAPYLFVDKIANDKVIDVYNFGNMSRDFTYIDDIVQGIRLTLDHPAVSDENWNPMQPSAASSQAPYRLYNIGNGCPVRLMDFINIVEQALGKKAKINLLPMQPGDVPSTHADISLLHHDLDYSPSTNIHTGVKQFVKWYQGYHSNINYKAKNK